MRILVTSGYQYWGDVLPSDLEEGERQIGGGETAMMQVSKGLAKLGHDVKVFYDTAKPGRYSGVDYLPTSLFPSLACQLEHDVLVSWDSSYALRYRDRAKLHVLAIQLNDAVVGVFEHAIDLYFHPSEWHAERFYALYPEMTPSKSRHRITNGIDPTRYVKEQERNSHRVIYSSSPDRGLHHLLRFWPKVVEQVPDAELHVFYDMDKWLEVVENAAQAGLEVNTAERANLLKKFKEEGVPGVTFHGGVGQARLAQEQLKSAVLAYPCDPVQPTEGFSMTCLEAITAGCTLITTDADALKELWADAPDTTILPLPVNDEVWVDTLVKALKRKEPRAARVGPEFTWTAVAKAWEKEFKEWLKAA